MSPASKTHDEVCGTPAGLTWHARHRVPSCEDCREAHRLRVQNDRDRSDPAGRAVRLPLLALADLLDLIPHDRASDAAALLGADVVDRTAVARKAVDAGGQPSA